MKITRQMPFRLKEQTKVFILAAIMSARALGVIAQDYPVHRKLSVTVKLMNEQKLSGELAYADSVGFMIWKGKAKHHSRYLPQVSDWLPWTSVQYVVMKENSGILTDAFSRLCAGMLVAYHVMGSAKEMHPSGCSGGQVENNILRKANRIYVKAMIEGNPARYLSILALLRRHAMWSSSPPDWKLNRKWARHRWVVR